MSFYLQYKIKFHACMCLIFRFRVITGPDLIWPKYGSQFFKTNTLCTNLDRLVLLITKHTVTM